MLRIKNVKYLSEYKLKLIFSDNIVKIVNLEDWIREGGVYFLKLKNQAYFKKVKMDENHYTICWPNGLDLCPDVLYEKGEEQNTKERTKGKKETPPKEKLRPRSVTS